MARPGNRNLKHDRHDDKQTYRVEVSRYFRDSNRYGDTRKYLIPGTSQKDAEDRAYKQFHKAGDNFGPRIVVKKVANYWREYD